MEETPQQPYDATTFRAYGQYGSTVFDLVDLSSIKKYLQVHICDACLRLRQDYVSYIEIIPREPVKMVYPWNPELHN